MADPICRWRNPTPKTVCELVSQLPKTQLSSDRFRTIMKKSIYGDSFFVTPYQLACQLSLYIETNDTFIPRFRRDITEEEAIIYLKNWFKGYYVPNPYTKKGFQNMKSPVIVVDAFISYLLAHGGRGDFKRICEVVFGEPINNVDILANCFRNYSDVITVDKSLHTILLPNYKDILSMQNINRIDKEAFFQHFVKDIAKETSPLHIDEPLQLIYYGAPGTGKSFTLDKATNEKNSVRTTFHPDSDYAGFVGAYKPTMENVDIHYISDGEVKYAKGSNNDKADKGKHPGTEKKIVYKYVPQAFLKAYVEAWKKYDEGEDHPYYLIIEEINRGNCAQIFGDLFQLLDRNNIGSSSYAISADEDIRQFLAEDDKGFAIQSDKNPNGLAKEQRDKIADFVLKKDSGAEEEIGESILDGTKLLLPPNLRIWATMNTSDQSLFPIDSAFKRRWNWEYMPIDTNPRDKKTQEPLNWKLEVGGKIYTWGSFLETMNPLIDGITQSEDKQMGYFFAKPDKKSKEEMEENDTISEKNFVNKVLFYLWTDVLKDYDLTQDYFTYKDKDADGREVKKTYKFTNFFPLENNPLLKSFVEGLKLTEVEDSSLSRDFVEETSTDSLTEEKNKKLWGAFFEYAKNEERFGSIFNVNRTPSKDSWMDFTIGIPGVWLNVQQLRTKSKVRVSIVIQRTSKTNSIYENKKTDLENIYSKTTGLETETKTTGKTHLVSVEFGNEDFDSLDGNNPIFKNIADNLILAQEAAQSILA